MFPVTAKTICFGGSPPVSPLLSTHCQLLLSIVGKRNNNIIKPKTFFCLRKLNAVHRPKQICFYSREFICFFFFSPYHVQIFVTPWTAAHQASLSLNNSQCLPKFMVIASMIPSSHLILCHPLLLLPSVFPSIRIFSSESVLRIRWPKYWSFSFSISPSSEHSELIIFRMDWLDRLAVLGTPKSLLQHHSSKALILQCSAFLIVQLSHLYMTTGKTTALSVKWCLCFLIRSLGFS